MSSYLHVVDEEASHVMTYLQHGQVQTSISLVLRDTETCIAAAVVVELPKHESEEDDRRVRRYSQSSQGCAYR